MVEFLIGIERYQNRRVWAASGEQQGLVGFEYASFDHAGPETD
jgi:hypothetical protein